ncbi:lysozyme [Paenibacillus cellulosilyticus]|uniref:Lysozyme n=1 Tax=Paenibacillus cellulosilyticus TaxID=375489 RepID=A0A2V2YLZ2_9BACL|nr:GH25 family lysozyme [Paenibacillus cellulosilyticus]PWV94524.1 lysozyme [Paenibacillus cellulosilyticus]QKS45029.1 glycoside hydrolase [Paenibacillus cellulosilyticus]
MFKKRLKYTKTSIILLILLVLGALEYRGVIWHNSLFALRYEVKGIDVSHFQGMVDWDRVSADSKWQFAYIKATEGMDMTDEQFSGNWEGAKRVGLKRGAYHFFTTQSAGVDQAEHYIEVVPKEEDSLPPVIDIEIALDKDADGIRQQLTQLCEKLEAFYNQRPILYVTYDTFNTYIADHFEGYEIWIMDIIKYPTLRRDREWTFWQYNHRARIAGIDGYVDTNVFHGSKNDFAAKFNSTSEEI